MHCSVFIILCTITSSFAFNIDVKFPLHIWSQQPGSHFGYAVAFHTVNADAVALITAPKGNSSSQTGVFEPGKLYQCPIRIKHDTSNNSSNCSEVRVEKEGVKALPMRSRLGFLYDEGKDGMWLGVSLDVQQENPHNIVVCGHRWHNTRTEFRISGYFPVNGVCYLLNSQLNSSEKLLPLTNPYQQIVPDYQNRRYNIYYYAFGQAGMAAIFSEKGDNLIMGAPGMFNWVGTALSYSNISDVKNLGSAVVPNPPFSQEISADSYLGYSVTSGKFFNNQELYFVAGAPKDKNYNGRVYIFEALSRFKMVMFVRQKISGDQMGAYFGAAVLSTNLNDDDHQDLVISAPLYSTGKLGGDEGRIYAYISDGVSLQLQKQAIMGRKKPGARFGLTIASCGDINKDGYNDIAVGAPYEDGHGAIYIYHGSSQGLQPQYSQVIAARKLFGSTIKGFGISIARSTDIDHNQYPDLLIGSYLSDSATVLRTRPVIFVGMTLEFSVSQISVHDGPKCTRQGSVQSRPCFKINSCFWAENAHSRPAHLTAILQMDPSDQQMKVDQRGYMYHKERLASTIFENLTLSLGQSCFETEVDVLEDNSLDYITPLIFRLTFDLLDETPKDSFCNDCPVLDPLAATSITKQLPFLIGCGADNFCTSDLHVTAKLANYSEREELIHGANTSVTLTAVVTNKGEPAYVSQLFIRLPSNVLVVNQGRCNIKKDQQASRYTIECKLGNPLKANPEKFAFKLDTSRLESHVEEVVIELEAVTTSRELNPLDNTLRLYLPFRSLADVTIEGYADRQVIAHAKDAETISMTHNYLIKKYLPSPVKSIGVALLVPTTTLESGTEILTIDSVEVKEGTATSVSGNCNMTFAMADSLLPSTDISGLLESNLTQSEKDTPNTIDLTNRVTSYFNAAALSGTSYIVNCNNTRCITLICELGPFIESKSQAKIKIAITVRYKDLILEIGDRENITVLTEGRVWINDFTYDVQPDDHRPDHAFVLTHLIKQGPPPPKVLPKWIIAVSVGAGILLLGLIILAMVQLGFFRRKKQEEMKNLLQQATVVDGNSFSNSVMDDEECDVLQ